MTQTPSPATDPADEEAAALVVVGRAIGGTVMVIVGLALALAGAFVFLVTPWVAPWTDDDSIWSTLSDLDFVGAIVGGLGLVLAFLGGGLVQRARRRKLQMFMDAGDLAEVKTAMSIGDHGEKSTGEKSPGVQPPTIL